MNGQEWNTIAELWKKLPSDLDPTPQGSKGKKKIYIYIYIHTYMRVCDHGCIHDFMLAAARAGHVRVNRLLC